MAGSRDGLFETDRYVSEIARIRGKLEKLIEENFIREAEGADHFVFWKLERAQEEKECARATCQFLAASALEAEEKRLRGVALRVSLRRIEFSLLHCEERWNKLPRITQAEEWIRQAWAWLWRRDDTALRERTTLRRAVNTLRANSAWYKSELKGTALPSVSLETARRDAEAIASTICACALVADNGIRELLADPRVLARYDYDGQFFYPKGTDGFHRAFDGTHVLSSLTDSCLESFFVGYYPVRENAEELIRWLTVNNIWITEIRIANWEAYGTLSLIPPRDLEALVAEYKEMQARSKIEPLSDEERQFFDILERQMKKTE